MPPYMVEINPDGSHTVLSQGNVVDGARVTQISFPSITSHTLHGDIHHIAGPGVATIEVPNVGTIANVPLRAPSGSGRPRAV